MMKTALLAILLVPGLLACIGGDTRAPGQRALLLEYSGPNMNSLLEYKQPSKLGGTFTLTCRGVDQPTMEPNGSCGAVSQWVIGSASITFTAEDANHNPAHKTLFSFTGADGLPDLHFEVAKGSDGYAELHCYSPNSNACDAVTVTPQ